MDAQDRQSHTKAMHGPKRSAATIASAGWLEGGRSGTPPSANALRAHWGVPSPPAYFDRGDVFHVVEDRPRMLSQKSLSSLRGLVPGGRICPPRRPAMGSWRGGGEAPVNDPVERPHGFSGQRCKQLFEDVNASSNRLHSSHFNSCVVGLVRAGAAFQAKRPYRLIPREATPRERFAGETAIAHPMQKS
jgi:hypothetical protein